MILNTIVQTIKRKSHRGNQSITTDQITLDIIACINETAREVQRMLPKRIWWNALTFNTTVGSVGVPARYSLDPSVQELSMIQYTTPSASGFPGVYYVVTKIDSDREWLTQIWNPVTTTQRPMWFREIGPDASGNKQIELFPIPDAVYTINYEFYRLRSPDMTVSQLSSAIPDIPDQYQDVLEKGALYKFYKQFDDPQQAVALKDYEDARKDMNVADENEYDTDLRIRLGKVRFELPGFRLT